jgi:hypothetical protein
VQHLNRLVEDLIEVSRFDAGTAGLLAEALSAAGDRAATLVRLVGELEPGETARLRAALAVPVLALVFATVARCEPVPFAW